MLYEKLIKNWRLNQYLIEHILLILLYINSFLDLIFVLIEGIMNSILLKPRMNFSCGTSAIHLLDESRLISIVSELNPEAVQKLISSLTSIDWSVELIKEYEHKWGWSNLSKNPSLPWSIELIKEYEHKWDWYHLSWNRSLPWSVTLIERYKDNWDWDHNYGRFAIFSNEFFPWAVKFFDRYVHKVNFDDYPYTSDFSQNLALSMELIERCKENWDWYHLSQNTSISWSIELIERYKENWDWYSLSQNPSLPWSVELIEKYKYSWDWYSLSQNKSLPYQLIKKYKNNLYWSIELL